MLQNCLLMQKGGVVFLVENSGGVELVYPVTRKNPSFTAGRMSR